MSTVITGAEAATLLELSTATSVMEVFHCSVGKETRHVIFPISPEGRSHQDSTEDLLLDEETKSTCGGKWKFFAQK